jgi:hypothetical protein
MQELVQCLLLLGLLALLGLLRALDVIAGIRRVGTPRGGVPQ